LIQPFLILQTSLRTWWIVVLGMVIGGALGFVFDTFLPSIYQAQSVITVNVDFTRTGPLTDVEEDYMIIAVGALIDSDEVVDLALQRAQEQGYAIDRAGFDRIRDLQRSFTQWLMIVRHPDPVVAMALANFWGETAREVLENAESHSLQVGLLQQKQDVWMICLQPVEDDQPAPSICSRSSQAEIKAEIDMLSEQLQEEKLAAHGLVNGTQVAFTSHAQFPAAPELRGRNALVLAGGLIGFLLSSVIVAVSSSPRRDFSREDNSLKGKR